MFTEPLEDKDMELTTENLQKLLGSSKDIIFKRMEINADKNLPVILFYVDGMVDNTLISDYILKPLAEGVKFSEARTVKEVIALIDKGAIYYPSQKRHEKIADVINDVLSGGTALVFDSERVAFTFDTKGFEKRPVGPPIEESSLKGAKDSFVETLRVNTATIRKRIRTPNLVIEETVIGKETQTIVAVVYIRGKAVPDMVAEVKKRLEKINVDQYLFAQNLEESFIDNRYTPFPQILYSEKPDKFCTNIIEGRVGIVVDGYPFAMIVPATFNDLLQMPDDYNFNFIVGSFYRFLRWILLLVTLFLPGFYLSITEFHQEMIPTDLALSIAQSREGVPFPLFVEAMLTVLAFHILIQAGVGVWKTIGNTVSIVGGLVLGEAAINAKFISPGVVVIVAIASIATLALPNFELTTASSIWQIIIIFLSSILGLFGLVMGGVLLLYHLSTIEVLGVPYLSPFVANQGEQMEDTLFRFPLKTKEIKPKYLKTPNRRR